MRGVPRQVFEAVVKERVSSPFSGLLPKFVNFPINSLALVNKGEKFCLKYSPYPTFVHCTIFHIPAVFHVHGLVHSDRHPEPQILVLRAFGHIEFVPLWSLKVMSNVFTSFAIPKSTPVSPCLTEVLVEWSPFPVLYHLATASQDSLTKASPEGRKATQ